MAKRVFLIVLDSFGVGAEPDAPQFGDAGTDTLGAIAGHPNFKGDNLAKLGMFNLDGVTCGTPVAEPIGSFARLREASAGKDTTIGHWEIAGLLSADPLPTFPNGFPKDLLDAFTAKTGFQVLCNKPYSGTEVIRDYGEEKWAARIAQMICEHRAKKPMETTFDLVHAVDAAIPKAVRRKDDGHPARRTFQAIRIAVNDELDPLDKAICDFVDCLKPGGRMLVITFHSLEDRLVKRCFQRLQNPCTCPPKAPICTCGKKPVVKILAHGAVAPTEEEVARNPRARSAKLRVAQKLEVL